jgi:hypothetical protein
MTYEEHTPFVQVPVDTSGRPLLIEHDKTGMLMALVPEGKFFIGDRGKMQGKCKPFEIDIRRNTSRSTR